MPRIKQLYPKYAKEDFIKELRRKMVDYNYTSFKHVAEVGIACRVTFYTTEESHTLWCDSSIIGQDVLLVYRTPSEPAFSLRLYTVFLPMPSVSSISSLIISPRISFARVSFTPSKSANTLLDAETWTVR